MTKAFVKRKRRIVREAKSATQSPNNTHNEQCSFPDLRLLVGTAFALTNTYRTQNNATTLDLSLGLSLGAIFDEEKSANGN